jgi:MerR family transcriptional regulator, copper efflux regulator
MAALLIGELAEQAGVATATIRYYESIGLLKPPVRSAAGYRRYSPAVVEELRFIRKAQALGFSLEEIGEILALTRAGKSACSHVLALAQRHLAALDERIRQLQTFRRTLAAEVARWDGQQTPTCAGLCEIILHAASDAVPDEVSLRPGAARRRMGGVEPGTR